MSKITDLDNLTSLANEVSAVATINANNAKIEEALENTLSLDGSTPNAMEADLDINGNRILNHPDPVDPTDLVTLNYLGTYLADVEQAVEDAEAILNDVEDAAATVAADASAASAAAVTAVDAAAEAVDAANKLTATSTSSHSISTGSKVFVIEASKYFNPGAMVQIIADVDPTNYVHGQVTGYSGTNLTVNVTDTGGSGGPFIAWTIKLSGTRGPQGVQGPAGPAGSGSGDMVAANNLNDVADKPTSFNNIKQAASTTSSGVVELATDAETLALSDASRGVTPSNIAALVASTTQKGIVKLATDAETLALSDTGRPVTPSNLGALVASLTQRGIVELATDAETVTGTDATRAATPSGVAAAISALAAAGVDVQTFTSSGTWTKPATGSVALIRCWGAGASGASSSSTSHGGGGGGGGAYTETWVRLSALSSTESVTIGAGGTAVTSGNGNAGGSTTLGTKAIAYGGGPGAGSSTTIKGGGGGGGALSAGKLGGVSQTNNNVGTSLGALARRLLSVDAINTPVAGRGGDPMGGTPASTDGTTTFNRCMPSADGGGAGGCADGGQGVSPVGSTPTWYSEQEFLDAMSGIASPGPGDGGSAHRGGGGGGGGGSTTSAGGYGGASIYGGGGGGGAAGDSTPGPGKGGLSKYAGKGGDGGYDTVAGTNGTAPSGGGGGSETGASSGAGARGECHVYVF